MLNKAFSHLPSRLLIGLSGGADSVALLQLAHDAGKAAAAVHVNHGLRGAASDGDEAFARGLCDALKVPLLVYRAEPPEHPGEGWAREARYAFFRQAMEATGADALALAHHRDDQAETVLLHLLRGSGLNGLGGMAQDAHVNGLRIVRPLLDCSRDELRQWLRQRGQVWREDESNQDARYLRNALRLDVLPMLERLAPGVSARLAETAALLRADEAVLHAQTMRFLDQHMQGRALPLAPLQAEMPAMQRRILRAWHQCQCGVGEERSLSAQQTEALRALIDANASARCNLPGDWHGQRGWTHLHLVSPEAASSMSPMDALCSPLLTTEPCQGHAGDGKRTQAIPRDMLVGLTVRSRQPGDWIIPFGGSGRQSLQDYMVNRRVDAPFRDAVPLLCRDNEVLLAGGVGAGNIPRMNDTTDHVLLRWQGAFPWCSDECR